MAGRPAGEAFLDDPPRVVGATPAVDGYLVAFSPFIGQEEMCDLVDELFREITDVVDALPVRILAGHADHLGFAFVSVAQPQHGYRLGVDGAARNVGSDTVIRTSIGSPSGE